MITYYNRLLQQYFKNYYFVSITPGISKIEYSHFVTEFIAYEEKLSDKDIYLTNLLFPRGSNVYVFSYLKNGRIRHTFIDTGDVCYINQMKDILRFKQINVSDIENIILTHHHPDHSGLTYFLAEKSGCRIIVPETFRDLVEHGFTNWERIFTSYFDPTKLKKLNLEYSREIYRINLGGLEFPVLAEISLNSLNKLIVFGCPQSNFMHTNDQQFVICSANNNYTLNQYIRIIRPADDILFSGDLWLMESPAYKPHIKIRLNFFMRQLRSVLLHQSKQFDVREQDFEAKEALKRAFSIIKVKPGHGKEFIGSRIIPMSILSQREILEFYKSYPQEFNVESSLMDKNSAINFVKKYCYRAFIDELMMWVRMGYSNSEVSNFLYRIYLEQTGGKGEIKRDRIERRESLKMLLKILMNDKSQSNDLQSIAQLTLNKLE